MERIIFLVMTVSLFSVVFDVSGTKVSNSRVRREDASVANIFGDLFGDLFGNAKTTPVPNATGSSDGVPVSPSTQAQQTTSQPESMSTPPTTTSQSSVRPTDVGFGGSTLVPTSVVPVSTTLAPTGFQETSSAEPSSLPTSQFTSQMSTESPPTSYKPTESITTMSPPGTAHVDRGSILDNYDNTCPASRDLNAVCSGELPEQLEIYLGWNLNVSNVESVVLFKSVLTELLLLCSAGEWCLQPVFMEVFPEVGEEFYDSPMCVDNLLSCLDRMKDQHQNCDDFKHVSFVKSLLSLLCDMGGVPGLTGRCFSLTLALLHVSVADIHRNDTETTSISEDICSSTKAKMIEQFKCVLGACPAHESFLLNFEPWQWFVADQALMESQCRFSDTCAMFRLAEEQPPTVTDRIGDMPPFQGVTTEPPEEINAAHDDGNGEYPLEQPRGTPASDAAEKELFRLVVGLSLGAVSAVLGLTVIACVCWRRMRRSARYGAQRGYTKLPSDCDEIE